MPTTIYCTIDGERAILHYSIVSTKSIDIRTIIHYKIRLSTNNHNSSYFFPQLIITLCTKVRVNYSKSEMLLQPGALLNPKNYNELTSDTSRTQRDKRAASSSKMSIKDEIH